MADLARKLGIKPGSHIGIAGAPTVAMQLLRQEGPAGVIFDEALDQLPYDIILFWPVALESLTQTFASLRKLIVPTGSIWAIMPKKQFAALRGIAFTWEQMQQAALQTDLVDNKTASFPPEDYATRFVIRRERRKPAAWRQPTPR